MKLATYNDGSRDGQLVVVSRDLTTAHYASGVANRLQQVLDDWNFISPQLQDLYQTLNHGKPRHAFPFDPAQCMAPLPRAFLWAAEAREESSSNDASMPVKCMASDYFAGPRIEFSLAREGESAGFSAFLVAATGDVAQACPSEAALDGVRLLLLAAIVSARGPDAAAESAEALATGFAPVAVTPDEVGAAWQQGLSLHLQLGFNGRQRERFVQEPALPARLAAAIAKLCARRRLCAASLVGARLSTVAAATQAVVPGQCLQVEAVTAGDDPLFGAIQIEGDLLQPQSA